MTSVIAWESDTVPRKANTSRHTHVTPHASAIRKLREREGTLISMKDTIKKMDFACVSNRPCAMAIESAGAIFAHIDTNGDGVLSG